MAIRVNEIMNPELFCVKPRDPVDDTLATLLALGLSAAPVVDETNRAVGFVSWRDLVRDGATGFIEERMTRPAVTIPDGATLDEAAQLLGRHGVHHAPVVDRHDVIVGFVSSIDLVRGMAGLPTPHPAGFPHYDERTGVLWTDELELVESNLDAVPVGPGVLSLIHGGKERPERIFWTEATDDLRGRILDLLSNRQVPLLLRWLDEGTVRFRVARVVDLAERKRIAATMVARMRREQWREGIGP